ncbi:hypothetical protein AOCH_001807 [Aspergillus ochraceoroseus]|uniref:Uncharacterized protein n=2 Tax=Aspergillus ochraceoroseus TaxID=138278 RepID=A0A0F8UC59_9EURO|nr:hypothetical protein AOCH_001807 [Aspergillus ochraceoroseus]
MTSQPSKQPLVRGGNTRLLSKLPSMFVSNTLPCIHDNTIILAATHPNVTTADPKHDGWFISDFYAFNILLKGLGGSQTWLTAADPEKLVQRYNSFLHGNPFQDRKVCLDREILREKRITEVTVIRSSNMIDQFLKKAKEASELAKRNHAPLLLLVFCHGLPNHHLLLDAGNQSKGLSILRLKGVLEPGVCVTLVTTACYSGGWATSPDLNHTTIAAAGDGNLLQATSHSWNESLSIGRFCGSVFASTLFKTLSSAASPLLEADLASDLSQAQQSLQPENPNSVQTLTYNAFCESVWRTCANSVTRLWSSQSFNFSAQDDAWDYSWTGRTGFPLADFRERWNALTSIPYSGSEELRALQDQDPSNPSFSASGPVRDGLGESVVDEMTGHIAQKRLKDMARLFRQTCPGDHNLGMETGFWGRLRGFYEYGEFEEDAAMIEGAIRFRWESALLADFIVEALNLPVPNGEICIMWDWMAWIDVKLKTMSRDDLFSWRSSVYQKLNPHFEAPSYNEQGPPFGRPVEYVVSALMDASMPEDELTASILAIIEFMNLSRACNQQRLCRDRGVRQRGREWLRTVGKRARQSLSPRKRQSVSDSTSSKNITMV